MQHVLNVTAIVFSGAIGGFKWTLPAGIISLFNVTSVRLVHVMAAKKEVASSG